MERKKNHSFDIICLKGDREAWKKIERDCVKYSTCVKTIISFCKREVKLIHVDTDIKGVSRVNGITRIGELLCLSLGAFFYPIFLWLDYSVLVSFVTSLLG